MCFTPHVLVYLLFHTLFARASCALYVLVVFLIQAKPRTAPNRLSPEYCVGHWTTQCLSAFGAPMDPSIVLGGYLRTKEAYM